MDLKCKLCGNILKSKISLALHISKFHKIKPEDYYCLFNKQRTCLVCGKKTKFISIFYGYQKTCCCKCANNIPEKVKLDKIRSKELWKNREFREKVTQKVRETCRNNEDYRRVISDKVWNNLEFRLSQRTRLLNGQAAYMNSFIKNPSKPQRELFELVKTLFQETKINFAILNYSIDIVIPNLKIAIEYDGSYWHQDKNYDIKRQKQIEELGWIFLRYVDRIPSIADLQKDISQYGSF